MKRYIIPASVLIMLLFSISCSWKDKEEIKMITAMINYEVIVLDSLNNPVENEPVYFRIFKYTTYNNSSSDFYQGNEISNEEGKIHLAYSCSMVPSELVRMFTMLESLENEDNVLIDVYYNDALEESTDDVTALMYRNAVLYKK